MSQDRRLVLPAASAWLVAWQGRLVPVSWLVAVSALGLLVGAAVMALRRSAAVAAVCICAAAAGLSTAARVDGRTTGPLPRLAATQSAVAVVGVVTDDPRRVVSRSGLGPPTDLAVVPLRVERLEAAGRAYRLRVPVLVMSSDQRWLPLLPSQRVRAEGRLRPAEPGDDVAAVLSGRGPPVVASPPTPVQRLAGHLRSGLRAAVAPLPAAERGLLPGLVVGDTSRLDPELRDAFRTTGLTHLVAVSGTNVAVVLGAALLLSRALGFGLVGSPVVSSLALMAFVVLARPSPSVLRAAVMGLVGLAALVSGSRRAALPSLCGAVLVLVLLAPDLAAAPGFALSVLATAGLVELAPPWRERLAARMPGWLADALAVPAAAQVACGPVIVAISGQLGLLSVPANLLAVPAVAPATVLGVLTALLAPLCLPLAQAVAWLAWVPTAWLVLIARTGASMPGATVGWPSGQRGALLLVAVTVVGGLVLVRRASRRIAVACAAGILVAVAGLQTAAPSWPPPGWFLVACDVGQGDAIALRAGPDAAVLVDAGPDPAAVDRCLRRLGVHALPLVLLTHLHADHVEGLPGALRGRAVGEVDVGPLDEPSAEHQRVVRWTADRRLPVRRPALGEIRSVGALRWQVLAPGRTYRGTRSDPNNASLVLRLETAGVVVLLTGDVEPEAQRDLLESGQQLQADVLKIPHHGSDHQLPAFLDAVGARVTLTSVGAGNTYGHPSAATLTRVMAEGARSYRTDRDGDTALVEDRGQLLTAGRTGTGTVGGPQAGARVGDRDSAGSPAPRAVGVLRDRAWPAVLGTSLPHGDPDGERAVTHVGEARGPPGGRAGAGRRTVCFPGHGPAVNLPPGVGSDEVPRAMSVEPARRCWWQCGDAGTPAGCRGRLRVRPSPSKRGVDVPALPPMTERGGVAKMRLSYSVHPSRSCRQPRSQAAGRTPAVPPPGWSCESVDTLACSVSGRVSTLLRSPPVRRGVCQ